jgi:hypothetical protein
MRSRSAVRLVPLLALVIALAACGTPAPPEALVVRGTFAASDELVLAVGMSMASAGAISPSTSFVLEPSPGFFLGELVAVGPDRAFAATLPGCAVVPNDIDARVSTHAFELITVPGLYAVTAESGLVATVAGTAPFDTSLDPVLAFGGRTVIAWLYADRPVDVASQGAGCSGGDFDLDLDLRLREGWNQVSWRLDDDLGGARVRNSAVANVVVTALPGDFGSPEEPEEPAEPDGL